MNPIPEQYGPPHTGVPNDNLKLVGTLLAVVGGLAVAFSALTTLLNLLGANDTAFQDPQLQAQMANNPVLKMMAGGGSKIISAAWGLVMIGVNVVIVLGGLKMRSAQSYNLAMAAACLAVVPCCFNSCCTVLSLPVGIAALIVLMKPENKALFSQ